MFDLNEMDDFYKRRSCDPREIEANMYIESAYDVNKYEEVTKNFIESINWNNYIATIGTIYGKVLTPDFKKIKTLYIRNIKELSFPNQYHIDDDRLNVSYIAMAKFRVRDMSFWEYYDKFPRVIKCLTDDGCIDDSTKFYIHKNYIHVFKPEEVRI